MGSANVAALESRVKLQLQMTFVPVLGQDYALSDMKTAIWIKRLGFWGFMFFLVKGLLWLLVPALAVYLVN